MYDVIELTCWRGSNTDVPVVGSKTERVKLIVAVPVLSGSKIGSPVGICMG